MPNASDTTDPFHHINTMSEAEWAPAVRRSTEIAPGRGGATACARLAFTLYLSDDLARCTAPKREVISEFVALVGTGIDESALRSMSPRLAEDVLYMSEEQRWGILSDFLSLVGDKVVHIP